MSDREDMPVPTFMTSLPVMMQNHRDFAGCDTSPQALPQFHD